MNTMEIACLCKEMMPGDRQDVELDTGITLMDLQTDPQVALLLMRVKKGYLTFQRGQGGTITIECVEAGI